MLGSINIKLDKLVNQETIEKPAQKIVDTLKEENKENPINSTEAPKKGSGKYTWLYSTTNDKLRKCDNEGCGMYLCYNQDKRTYDHWKYDPNTKIAVYAQDTCDHWEGS